MENVTALIRPISQMNHLLGRLVALLILLAKEWLSTREVALIEEIAEDTVRGWCEKGRIKAKKLPSGEWRIHKSDWLFTQEFGLLPLPLDRHDNGFSREQAIGCPLFRRRQGNPPGNARGAS